MSLAARRDTRGAVSTAGLGSAIPMLPTIICIRPDGLQMLWHLDHCCQFAFQPPTLIKARHEPPTRLRRVVKV